MQIAEGSVVSIDYALKDDEGVIIDQSQPGNPMTYLHGHRNIIPGLESALNGKSVGESAAVRVAPEDGYGEPNPALEQVIPKDRFQGIESLDVGMQFQASTEQGPVSVRVVKIDGDDITVDGNHPLAGKHLNFDITVQDIREASEEELQHGHPHNAGGCCGGGSCESEEPKEGGCCGGGEAKSESEGSCGCA